MLRQLQSLRQKLHEIAEVRGSLTDPAVLAISEEADQLIVALQHIQRTEFELTAAHREKNR
ncbi:aspartyl-phosphate phosphatase Spo0E family protein [Paenibacillus sp. 1011MAR3C5]|uniref:aspartyl-phosphate phosphatase Spo0E family protein n=1 Tax=Paenibacillus sp. 1011MAR3C5 TaxID=1675787 RepID=UPI00217590C3|nr:aspartyl-phosphate phosphatase Spo0E family protein [Paenibacillus sp. 1011MAR3C5]